MRGLGWSLTVGRDAQAQAWLPCSSSFLLLGSWTWTLGIALVKNPSKIEQLLPNSFILFLPENHIKYALFTNKNIFQRHKTR